MIISDPDPDPTGHVVMDLDPGHNVQFISDPEPNLDHDR